MADPSRSGFVTGVTVTETSEWTVVVFPRGQGHWRRVIHPGASFNKPPLEGDWAHHPCCGTICTMRSMPLRKPTGQGTCWSSSAVKADNSVFEMLSDSYDHLPELSCFEPIEVVVDSSEVMVNKSGNVKKDSSWLFPTQRKELSVYHRTQSRKGINEGIRKDNQM